MGTFNSIFSAVIFWVPSAPSSFAEVPEERDPRNFFGTNFAIALPLEKEMRGGVEKEIADIAIAVGELEFVGGLLFDVLFAG
jgi:hypothetical protein